MTINRKREFKKNCSVCNSEYIGNGPAAKLCPKCKEDKKAYWREYGRARIAAIRAATGEIKKPGVGKGGNPLMGKDNPSYKHGLYVFETLRYAIKKDVQYCERCNKDLKDAGPYKWAVHHKDHNHWNHVRDNLELLCTSCHHKEHDRHLNFTKGATTIP
ncbi:HNH nuclease [Xanthomonas phage DES1]|nr:HNH nuclease [Xanthomonas phage DES1]